MRDLINLIEAAFGGEPSWVTQVFDLPPYGRQTFDLGGVDLQVAAMGVELRDEEQPLGIKHIEVPLDERGQGKASAILRELVKGANARGRPLELSAYPYEERRETGKATPEQVAALVKFYAQFGFVAKDGANYNHPVTMVYRPTVTEAAGDKTPIPLDFDPDDGHCVAFDEGDHIFLNALYASRKGGGARMLQKVIDYATARSVPVELLADGDDGLVNYYEQFGFEMIGWEQNLMRLETVGLGHGSQPVETLDGCVTYDARDGQIVAEFEEEDRTIIVIRAVQEGRPGGARRLRAAVAEFGRSQLYPVRDDTI